MLKNFLLYSFLSLLSVFYSCKKQHDAGYLDYQTLGSSAKDLLSESKYTTLQIEIQYMPGYAPDAVSVSNLINFLSKYINKSGGIHVSYREIPSRNKSTLTIDDIVSVEKVNRNLFTGGDVIAVHILITDGNFSSPNVLAISYWNTSVCLFGKIINDNSGGVLQPSRTGYLSTILEHESGHLLGLVGQGSPVIVDHKDAVHGYHCSNTNCLMYYGIETADKIGQSLNNTIPSLDANCIADVKANGGK